MQQTISTGLSMPKPLKDWIDRQRGDIPRSKYITKMLQEIQKHHNESSYIEDSQSEQGSHLELTPKKANHSTRPSEVMKTGR